MLRRLYTRGRIPNLQGHVIRGQAKAVYSTGKCLFDYGAQDLDQEQEIKSEAGSEIDKTNPASEGITDTVQMASEVNAEEPATGDDSEFGSIITLGSWQTGLMPRTRHHHSRESTDNLSNAVMKPSFSSETALKYESTDMLLSSPSKNAVNIEDLKPKGPYLPKEHLETLKTDLLKGFGANQLKEYLRSKGCRIGGNKRDRVHRIIDDVWGVKPAVDIQSESSFVPTRTITLEPKLFSLCLSDNGKLLREWAKSGSRIKVDSSRSQLHVAAVDSTFRWIQATLQMLSNSLYSRTIDFSHFPEPVSQTHLNLIQALTNSYMEPTSSSESHGVVVTCLKRLDFFNTRAYFAQLLPKTHIQENYWYDVNASNIQMCKFRPFADNKALDWMHRLDTWHRWEYENPKVTSDPAEFESPEYAKLQAPSFDETSSTTAASETRVDLGAVISQSIASDLEQLEQSHQDAEVSLTSTFGQILSRHDRITKVPDSGMKKLFVTQVPFVSAWAASQPPISEHTSEIHPNVKPANELEKLFELTDEEAAGIWKQEQGHQQLQRKSEQMLRVRLRPEILSPNDGYTLAARLEERPASAAALELWIPYVDNKAVGNDATVLAILEEKHYYVSLPQSAVDLKIALTSSKPLDLTTEIRKYISTCYIDEAGTARADSTLRIVSKGNDGASSDITFYMLESAQFHSRSETAFNNDTLCSSCMAGSIVGNHNFAVDMIAENGEVELAQYIERFVKNSIVACDEISAQRLTTRDMN